MSSFGSEHADKGKQRHDSQEPVLLRSELIPPENFLVLEHSVRFRTTFIDGTVDHPDDSQVQDDQEHVGKPHPDRNLPEQVYAL